MRTQFYAPKPGAPPNLVAECAIFFDADTQLAHMKLVGISVWKSNDPSRGDYYVTFPSRQTGATGPRNAPGEARYFDYLRAADPAGTAEAKAATAKLKNKIVAAFKREFLKGATNGE